MKIQKTNNSDFWTILDEKDIFRCVFNGWVIAIWPFMTRGGLRYDYNVCPVGKEDNQDEYVAYSNQNYINLNEALTDAIFHILGPDEADLSKLKIVTVMNKPHYKYDNNGEHIKRKQRGSVHYAWQRLVKERDGYKCVECGKTKELHAHHIKSYINNEKDRWDVNNGITLCVKCHRMKHSKAHANLITKEELR